MSKQILFKGFKLGAFRAIIEQSLIVDKQLIFQFSKDFIRSCSYSTTKSFLKLVTTPTTGLSTLFEDFEKFDLYVLRGDLFKKFLSVYASDEVDMAIDLMQTNSGELKATRISVLGKTENGNQIEASFTLSSEEMLTNKIDDFAKVIESCNPTSEMSKFVISDLQNQEVKRLIKKLHKSSVDNTPYLTFATDKATNSVVVRDRVFNVRFDMPDESPIELDSEFNILKSDFIIAGNQTFSIYYDNNDARVLLGGAHANSIIWCLLCKVSNSVDEYAASVLDSTIDDMDLEGFDLDDL